MGELLPPYILHGEVFAAKNGTQRVPRRWRGKGFTQTFVMM